MSVLNQTHRTLCIISELVPCYHRFITDAFCCMKILSEEKEKNLVCLSLVMVIVLMMLLYFLICVFESQRLLSNCVHRY